MKTLLFLALLSSHAVMAQDLRILSGGAAKAFIDPLAASSPVPVKVEYLPMGPLTKALAAGDPANLVVVTSEIVEAQKMAGGVPIARVGIGVAVHERAPAPDISTSDAFKRALQTAKSVVYIDPKIGTSGKHVAEVLQRLGIADEVNRKATLGTGGYVVAPVGKGEIELGIHQISEILPVPGVKLVGPLPAELQKYTVYVAVPRKDNAAVKAFIAHLTGPQAGARLAQAGYTSPGEK
jgi:molybdate transport system substrate-binding protein